MLAVAATTSRAKGAGADGPSGAEQEVHHIAILDDVFLAFRAHLAGILGALLALVGNEVFIGDGLGPDVALLEIGVNHASRLRSGITHMDRPGTHFLHAR